MNKVEKKYETVIKDGKEYYLIPKEEWQQLMEVLEKTYKLFEDMLEYIEMTRHRYRKT